MNLLIGYGYSLRPANMFEKLWKMFLFALIFARLATTRGNLRIVLWTLVAGSLYLGYDAFTAPASAFYLGRLELIGGPDFSTTSGLAGHLAAMLPIIGVVFLTTDKWKWRALALAAGILSLNTIIMCRTRSAFVGLVCGALAAMVMAPRVRRYRILCLLAVGSICAIALTDTHFWDRMGTLTDRQALATDGAAVSRADIWKASLSIIADYPHGIGPGNFSRVIGNYDSRYHYRASHNTLLVCFTEYGIHGGIILLMIIAGSLRLLYKCTRLAPQSDQPLETTLLAYGFLVSFVTYFITGLGTGRFYCESFWWVLLLPLCLYRVVVREATADAEEPELARTSCVDESPALLDQPQYGY
jgi:hypothetical protein